MTVDGTVTAQQAAASTFQHSAVLGLTGNRGCVVIAQPPANKALIVREVRVDVFNDPSPGPSQTVSIFAGLGCNTIVGDVNPPTVGQTVVPFDPGIGVPAASGLSAFASGSVQAETYTDGYSVPSSQVPASAVSQSGRRAQR
jgi:hypothetical protein